MTEATLNRCQKWQLNKRVCYGSWPWNNANNNTCEASPFKPNIPSNCIYKTVSTTNSYWIELDRTGNFLFKVPTNTKANIQCRHAQQDLISLSDQGILTINADCTVRTVDKKLIASHNIHSKAYEPVSSTYISELSEIPKIIWDPLTAHTLNHTAEIDMLKRT